MAKTRLNSSDRETLTEQIVGHKFNRLQLLREQEEFDLAKEAYAKAYPATLVAKMGAMPKGSFPTDTDICVSVSGKRFDLNFSPTRWGHPYAWEAAAKPADAEQRPFLYKHYQDVALAILDGDDFGDRAVANQEQEESLQKERQDMLIRVRATLDNFRYFDDLLTAFPEAESFIMKRWRERPEGGSPGVPAVVIKDLARALDLPPLAA